MNTINKALIAVLGVQGLLAVLMLGRVDSTRLGDAELLLPDFSMEAADRIEIFQGTEDQKGPQAEPQLRLAKENGIWLVKSHHDYPADPEKVETFLKKLADLSSRGPLAGGVARQTQLSVADDKYQRKALIYSKNRTEPLVIYVGGGAGGRKSAVRIGGHDDIHAVLGFSASSAQYAVTSWVNSTYLEVPQLDVQGLTISNASGTYALERNADRQWQLIASGSDGAVPLPPDDNAATKSATEPQTERVLDQLRIDNIIRSVVLLRFNEPASPKIPRGSPLATITLRVVPGSSAEADAPTESAVAEEYVIMIGPEHDGRYVVSRDQAPAVLIHMNHLEAAVNLSPETLYTTARRTPAGAAPAGGHGAAPAGGHGAAPAGGHGAAPAGGHGAAPAGGHGAAPAGGHGAAPAGGHDPG